MRWVPTACAIDVQPVDDVQDEGMQRRLEAGDGWREPTHYPTYKHVPHDGNGLVTGQRAMLDNGQNYYALPYCEAPVHATAQAMVVAHPDT